MRRVSWILVCLLFLLPAPVQFQAGAQQVDPNSLLEIPKKWRKAVAKHAPGEADAAAISISNQSRYGIEGVLLAIGAALGKESTKNLQYKRSTFYKTGYFTISICPVPVISFDVPGPAGATIARSLELAHEPNQVLKRGALLHSDIALLGLGSEVGNDLVETNDGLSTGFSGGQHWKYARLLLHWSSPDPSRDAMIRRWYIATTAHMFSQCQWGLVELNLLLAQKYFPEDPTILFYAGVMHELYASAKSQNTQLPNPASFYFDPKDKELNLAVKFFKQTLQADPNFAEARLHFGRVLGLCGKHEEAVAELRRAADRVHDPLLQYYDSLFLGYEFMMLDRYDEARTQFECAQALFPAQSPLLGLSRLAQRSGNMQDASLSVLENFKLQNRDSTGPDPWWSYDQSHVRNAPALISEMRAAFGGLSK